LLKKELREIAEQASFAWLLEVWCGSKILEFIFIWAVNLTLQIPIELFFFVSVVLIVEQNVKTIPINHQTLTSCVSMTFFQEKQENEFNESYKY